MTGDYWDETHNTVVGCDKVTRACDHCFAIRAGRIRSANPNAAVAAAWAGTVTPIGTPLDWTGEVNLVEDRLDMPYRWAKPRRIYTTLVGDMFHSKVTLDFLAQYLARVATTRRHIYLNTTKRPGIMRSRINNPQLPEMVHAYTDQLVDRHGAQPWDGTWPLPNLHLGVSIEDQETAEQRIPALFETPAAVRWVSAEPLLGPVQLWDSQACDHHRFTCAGVGCWRGLDWVVAGGETGSDRPSHPDWFRSLRDQCLGAAVPFWFKQFGDWSPQRPVGGPLRSRFSYLGPNGERFAERNPPDMDRAWACLYRVGAKAAGRELDGRTWDQLPEVCNA